MRKITTRLLNTDTHNFSICWSVAAIPAVVFNTCPIAAVHAHAERVWDLLSQPTNYAQWWDARTRAITPVGSAQPGQRIEDRRLHLVDLGM